MGFKDLRTFNKALLAKQGWRLMQNEDSLLYEIFKARYFPLGKFLDSTLGINPSYVWKCIWEVKEKLAQECRWRVGNRRVIKIQNDICIPGFRQLIQSINENEIENKEAKVEELIDNQTKWWDVSKVRNLLTPAAANEVLKIILNPRKQEDKQVWAYENDGKFSVRTAYRLFRNMDRKRV